MDHILHWQRTARSSTKVRICINGYMCGSESVFLQQDVRVSSLSAAVRTDGGGLGGRSTTFFIIIIDQVFAVFQGTPQLACWLHPPCTHCSPLHHVHVLTAACTFCPGTVMRRAATASILVRRMSGSARAGRQRGGMAAVQWCGGLRGGVKRWLC